MLRPVRQQRRESAHAPDILVPTSGPQRGARLRAIGTARHASRIMAVPVSNGDNVVAAVPNHWWRVSSLVRIFVSRFAARNSRGGELVGRHNRRSSRPRSQLRRSSSFLTSRSISSYLAFGGVAHRARESLHRSSSAALRAVPENPPPGTDRLPPRAPATQARRFALTPEAR